MSSFASMVLERGAATLAQVEGAMENQLLCGGDLGTNLVAAGALKENALHRLLSEFHELPVGPHGRLTEPAEALEELVPPDLVLLHRVYPIKRTRRTLHLAVATPLEPEVEQHLRRIVGMQLRPVVVTPLRLAEALWRSYGAPLTERDKRLLINLETGDIKPQISPFTQDQAPVSWVPPAPAYRRMSEHPRGGVSPSIRQPASRRRSVSAQLRRVSQPVPDTLDGVGPDELESDTPSPTSAGPPTSAPPVGPMRALTGSPASAPPPSAERPFGTEASLPETAEDAALADRYEPEPFPPASSDASPPPDVPFGLPGSDAPEPLSGVPGDRDTQPYGEDGKEGKRNTRPWVEDEEGEPPGSLRGEFHASLIEPPPSVGQVHPERRAFRHRGPFTRAQAELAASQALDVQTVLEILLRYARQFFERSVLFVVQGGEAHLRISNGIPRELAELTIDLDEDSVFAEACSIGDPIVRSIDGSGDEGASTLDVRLARRLGASSGTVTVVPLQIRERVVALFYGDDGIANVDGTAVEDVTEFTEICAGEITRVIIQQKRAEATTDEPA